MGGLRVLAVALLLFGQAFADQARAPTGRDIQAQLDQAIELYRAEGAERALPKLREILSQTEASPKSPTRAMALQYVGECYWRLGDYEASRSLLNQALTLYRALGDRTGEGKTLNVLGLLAWDQGNYDEAQARFRQTASRGSELRDRRMQGSALNNLGLVMDELGDYDASLASYRQALELYRGQDFPRGEGDTLGNIGGVYLLLGRYSDALRYYEQALAISQRLGSKASLSQDNGNIGLCYLGLGQTQPALERFTLAVELARQAGMRRDEAYWLREMANAHVQQGRYDLALRNFRLALRIHDELGAKAGLVESLTDVGRLYLLMGDLGSAKDAFVRASAVARNTGFDRGVIASQVALGDIEARTGDADEAAANYREALAQSTESKQPQLIATALLRIAALHLDQSRVDEAEAAATQAAVIARDNGYRSAEAEAALLLGESSRLDGKPGQALSLYQQAQAANASIGDPEILWKLNLGRAKAYEAQGKIPAAMEALQTAVRTIEGVRSRLEQRRFRASYLEDKYEVYRELMRLQMGQGQVEQAFDTAERLRARSFEDQLGGRYSDALPPAERRREAELRERVRQLREASGEQDDEGNPAYTQRARDRFSAELLALEREYQAFIDDHVGAAASDVKPPGQAALATKRRLGSRQALLEFVVGPDATTVFLVRRDRIEARVVPVRYEGLSAQVALLNDLIVHRAPDDRWLKPARRLFQQLIKPLEVDGALRDVDHLYIVPHGPLTSLPFAVLPSGQSATPLLIDAYSIAYLPAAAALASPTRLGADNLLAVAPASSHLPYAINESRWVAEFFKPRSTALLGPEATETRFKRDAGNFAILHVASHGKFDGANPLFSGIELESDASNDGLLQVHEILALTLRAQLVNLSACETARATGYFTDRPASDDLIGLARAFLVAGSRSVVATLWPIEDRSSWRTMQLFYSELRSNPVGPASSLAATQRRIRARHEMRHPYYWAPYVLIGAT